MLSRGRPGPGPGGVLPAGRGQVAAEEGFEGPAALEITATFHPRRVRLGQSVQVRLHVANHSLERQRAVVDLAVHFVKASGAIAHSLEAAERQGLLDFGSCATCGGTGEPCNPDNDPYYVLKAGGTVDGQTIPADASRQT